MEDALQDTHNVGRGERMREAFFLVQRAFFFFPEWGGDLLDPAGTKNRTGREGTNGGKDRGMGGTFFPVAEGNFSQGIPYP